MIGAAARGVKGGRLTSPSRATKLSSATPRRLSLDARLQFVAAATPAEAPPLPPAAGATIFEPLHFRNLEVKNRILLDVFSDAEIAVRENYGYLMADIAIQRHGAGFAGDAPARPAHPDWLDEGKVRAVLADSHKTKLFARGW